MTTSDVTKPGTAGFFRYSNFAITVGEVFAIFYVIALHYGWALFTYYPAVNEWVLYGHSAAAASPGPAMKWFGYVASSCIVAALAGLIVLFVFTEDVLKRRWWPGFVWLLPTIAMLIVFYLIATE